MGGGGVGEDVWGRMGGGGWVFSALPSLYTSFILASSCGINISILVYSILKRF